MTAIVIIAFFWLVGKILSTNSAEHKEQRRTAEIQRIKLEQKRQNEEAKAYVAEQRRIASEQARQAKEQERLAKEQTKQAEMLAKHEEQIMKLEQRMGMAENEIAFNREQRERLWKLLEIEELERDSAIEGSATWQKHHRKVISLENQLHTVEKRINKAQMDKIFCEKKLSA